MASLASLLDGEDQDHNDRYNEEFASMYDVNPEFSRDIVIDEVEMQRYCERVIWTASLPQQCITRSEHMTRRNHVRRRREKLHERFVRNYYAT